MIRIKSELQSMKFMKYIGIGMVVFVFIFILKIDNGFCGRSRVMIIANKASTTGALGVQDPSVRSAVQRVASYFVDKSVGVYDETAMANVYSEIELIAGIDTDVPDNRLIELALKSNAEVLVKMEVFAIPFSSNATDASARVIAKMFRVSNGSLLAMSEQYGTNRAPSSEALKAALDAAASKAGGRVGKRLYAKLAKNHPTVLKTLLRTQDVPGYIFIFNEYTEAENDMILDILYEELGLPEDDIKELKVTPRYLEAEIFFQKKFGRMVRKLKKILQQEGLESTEKSRDAGKVVFVKKGASKKSGGIIIE